MKRRELIQAVNASNDAKKIRRLLDQFARGGVKLPTGESVIFTYAETREFFKRCDPTIDDERFEELCAIADIHA